MSVDSVVLDMGLSSYTLASDLNLGQHLLRLTKRTEAMVGATALGSLLPLEGNLIAPLQEAPAQMVFYGVSNEAGSGDLAAVTASNMCAFGYDTEDASKAYAALAATSLGLDLVNISYAGKGVMQNAYPLYDARPLPLFYDAVDPMHPRVKVDFSGAEPAVVGVDLGGNDFSGGTPDGAAFVQAYTNFLLTLRGHYPHAPIVCVMGPMMTGSDRTHMQACIEAAIAARAQAGDARVSFVPFDVYNGDTYGCSYHPSAALQADLATVFAQHVHDVMP